MSYWEAGSAGNRAHLTLTPAGIALPNKAEGAAQVVVPLIKDEVTFSQGSASQTSINPELEASQSEAIAALPGKHKMPKLYSAKQVLQSPLNRAARFAIRYGYQWPARSPESPFSGKAQQGLSKCGCRIHGETALSCSEYGYRAFEVLPFAWATTLTFIRSQLVCNPLTNSTALGNLLDEPLPFKDFMARAKVELKGKPLFDFGDPKEMTYMLGGALLNAVQSPFYWAYDKFHADRPSGFFSKKGEIQRIARFEEAGKPEPCKALFNFNARSLYFNSIKTREFQPRHFENKRLNSFKIEPDKEREKKTVN